MVLASFYLKYSDIIKIMQLQLPIQFQLSYRESNKLAIVVQMHSPNLLSLKVKN